MNYNTRYRVSWNDSHTGQDKHLDLHSVTNAKLCAETLRADKTYRWRNVTITRLGARRLNEIVIVFPPA